MRRATTGEVNMRRKKTTNVRDEFFLSRYSSKMVDKLEFSCDFRANLFDEVELAKESKYVNFIMRTHEIANFKQIKVRFVVVLIATQYSH